MSASRFFDFGDNVRADVRGVVVLHSSYTYPHDSVIIEQAVDHVVVGIGADPAAGHFIVVVTWKLVTDGQEHPSVELRVATEFVLEDFSDVFSISDDGVDITPKRSVDGQFFSIAYSTLRGVAAAHLAGTPWIRRLPPLMAADDLQARAQSHNGPR
jgi:hypothetical protein